MLTAANAAWYAGCGEPRARTPTPPTASPQPARRATSRGGTLRVYNFDAQLPDTLDPHLTLFGPVANVHAAVFSRVLRYVDPRSGVLEPDLAEEMPEQPDELTYVIRLHPDARFHDAPKFRLAYAAAAGRPVSADDLKFSIERQLNATSPNASRFYRANLWSAIETVRVPARDTVVVRLKSPAAPFLAFLASRHAFIIPREIASAGDEAASDLAMIGSGPFMLDAFEPGAAVRLRRNPDWFRAGDDPGAIGSGRPFLDAYVAFYAPQEDLFQRAAFDRKVVDATGLADPASLQRALTTNLQDVALDEADGTSILASRFLVDRPPFADDRLRRAVHLAIDRAALAALLFPPFDGRPSARLSGPVAPTSKWALPDEDLLKRPGYGAQRDDDAATARQLWSAATGDAMSALKIVFAGVPRIIPDRAFDTVVRRIKDVLGVSVEPVVDTSGTSFIAGALRRNIDDATEGVVTFTFAFEDGGEDLDDWLFQFRSGQQANTYRLRDATLDDMLDRQRAEFDTEARVERGRDIQDYLIGKVNARLEFLAPVERRLSWGYVRNWRLPSGHGAEDRLADTWLDRDHPAWRGRMA